MDSFSFFFSSSNFHLHRPSRILVFVLCNGQRNCKHTKSGEMEGDDRDSNDIHSCGEMDAEAMIIYCGAGVSDTCVYRDLIDGKQGGENADGTSTLKRDPGQYTLIHMYHKLCVLLVDTR